MVTSRWELFRGSCSSPNCLTTKTDAAIPVFPSVPRGHLLQGPALRAQLPKLTLQFQFFPSVPRGHLLQGPALRASTRYSTPHHAYIMVGTSFRCTSCLLLSVVLAKAAAVLLLWQRDSHRNQSPLQFVSSATRLNQYHSSLLLCYLIEVNLRCSLSPLKFEACNCLIGGL